MKSFFLSELEIIIIFRKPLNFLIDPVDMQLILINLEKKSTLCLDCSLLIVLKGEPLNNTYVPSIILGSPLTIVEKQAFRIENLRFEIPYFAVDQETNRVSPFLYIRSDEFYLENCSFVTNQNFYVNNKGELLELEANEKDSEFFNENYISRFEMRLENAYAFLKNIEIEIKGDNFDVESIFQVTTQYDITITNLLIKNTFLKNLNLIYIWIRTYAFSKILQTNVSVINSNFTQSKIFVDDSKEDFGEVRLNIKQMTVSNIIMLSSKVIDVVGLANHLNTHLYFDSVLIKKSYFENSLFLSSGERIMFIDEFILESNLFNQSTITNDLTENLINNLFLFQNTFLVKFKEQRFFKYYSFLPTIISDIQKSYSNDERFLIFFESNQFIELEGRKFFFLEFFNADYLTIKSGSFENLDFIFVNQSNLNLFNTSQSKVSMIFQGCRFIDVDQKNGGIYFYNKEIFQKDFVISDCLFLGVAFEEQKIIYEMNVKENREINFKNIKFLKCKVTKKNNLSTQYALISILNSQLSLFDLTIIFENCEFDYSNINFVENSVDLISFILLNSFRAELLITNSTFKVTHDNYQKNENHIFLSVQASTLVIIHSSFEFDNIQMNMSTVTSIFVKARIVTLVINSTFFKNLQSSNNGALCIIISQFGESKIGNCSFLNLSAENGAALSVNSVNNQYIFYIENSFFYLIVSEGKGGVFHILSIILFVKNCKFVDFFSHEGGLLFTIQSDIHMLYCIFKMTEFLISQTKNVFKQNLFEIYSGPAFSVSYQSKLILEECEISQIWPPVSGFSLLKLGISELACLNMIFRDNLFVGGGISSSNSKIDFTGVKFIDNSMVDCDYITFDNVCLEKGNLFYESIIVISSESAFRMNASLLFHNHLEKANFIKSDVSSVILQRNSFIDNKGVMGTILSSYRTKNYLLFNVIESCLFKLNEASNDGGALFFFESNFSIINSSFIDCNSIKGRGGAVSIQCPQNWMPTMIDVIFINNSALIGGAIYFNLYRLLFSGNYLFRDNWASLFGNTFFSYPKKLILIDNQSFYQINDELITNNLRSGDKLSNFLLRMLDEDDETIKPNSFFDYQLEILNPDNSIKKFYMDKTGCFNLSAFYVTSRPNSTLKLNMSCEFIFNHLLVGSPKIFKIIINFRPCQIGELYRKTPLEVCEPCSPDKYSYNISDESCKLCPSNGAICSKKLNGIFFIHDGFWRNKLESDLIIKCFRLEDNCIEGFEAGDGLCFEGHVGARCESCDGRRSFWNETFAKDDKYSCVKCSEAKYGFLYFFVSFGLFSVFLGVSLKGLIRFIELEMNLRQNVNSKQGGKDEELGFYIKILLFYFQIIASISEFDLPLSSYLDQTLNGVGSPLSFSLYSLDCLLSYNFGQLTVPIVFLRMIVTLLIPILYLAITYLFYMVWLIKSQFKYKDYMKKSLIIFNFLYFQKSLTSQIVRVIACEKIADEFYIKADVSFKCNTPDHLNYSFLFFIPSLLFIIVIFPLIVGWRIYLKRRILNELETRTEYGYLYNEYKVYYWEFLKMYMKVLISIFLEFYDSDIYIKGLLILLIIFGYLILLQKMNPYLNEILNKLEAISSIVCFLSILICLLAYKNEYLFMVIISIIFLVVINTGFTLFLARKIFLNFLVKIIENIKLFRKNREELNCSQSTSKNVMNDSKRKKITTKIRDDLSEIYEKALSNIELEDVHESFRNFKKNTNILNTT